LVSSLIPINADRVDLLVCNANSISDQIVTGHPYTKTVLSFNWAAVEVVGETVTLVSWFWVGSACSRF
jgi:hypothetical protein